MPEQSQVTKRVLKLAEELSGFKVVDPKKAEPPFMQEGLSKRDFDARFARWSTQEQRAWFEQTSEKKRRTWMTEHGTQAALRLVQGAEGGKPFAPLGSSPAEGEGFKPTGGRPQ